MTEPDSPPDLLAAIIGAPAGSPIDHIRRDRPDIVRHSQGSHDVLLSPQDPGGVSPAERALIAWRVADLSGHKALAAHYRAMLDHRDKTLADAATDARLATILDHVVRLTTAPGTATKAHIDALRATGLTERDIVAISQLVAFVAYQVRAAAGLALLVRDAAA